MAVRKTPVRTCVGCRREADKRDLIRFVRDADGEVHVDPTGKAVGRGASICATTACFEAAAHNRRLGPALRASLNEEDMERLRSEFEEALRTHGDAASRSGR
ncbi:MAG: YlxR family protein [Coriobacteriia bacterium]|nr:YlxR family protein [Coriobacteriia bacterium]